ncbi:glycosyltransferase family 25 protein [Methylophilus sp.]|uniref:glycosyltransferase family 25 protein n=1 Tax=Methylophilus sp. TaxID=29541 RepID=UPI003FA03F7D
MQTYLINLDKAQARLNHMREKLDELGISFQRVSAVNGMSMTDAEYDDFYNKIGSRSWDKGGGIGCFLSHFETWKLVANGDEDYALVLEDDMHFSADAKKLLSDHSWMPDDFDIIRLETSTSKVLLKDLKDVSVSQNKRHLAKLVSTAWCAGAYIISKKCAQNLLAVDPKNYMLLDAFLFCYEESPVPSSISLYQVSPAIAIQDKFIESDSRKGLASDIEINPLKVGFLEFKTLLRSFRILAVVKILQGYKRIQFQ